MELAAPLAKAEQLAQAGDTAEAIAAYRALLPAAPANELPRAKILDALSALETDSGDYDAAIADADAAAAIYATLRDLRSQASSINQVGLTQMYAGSYPRARESLLRALTLATAAHDAEAQVEEWMNLASVDFFTARYADASRNYQAAGRMIEAHGAEEWTRRRRRILLANQATLDQRLGRYDQALAEYRGALSDAAELRPAEHAQMLVNLGVVYRRLGDPYKALAVYDQALALFAQDEQLDGELGVLKNRGIVLALDLGKLDEARQTFASALARATKAGSAREALQARLYQAETLLRLGMGDAAAEDFRLALEAARSLQTVEEQWKALYGLGRAELLRGDETSAAQHLRESIGVIEKIREAIRVPTLKSDFFNDKRDVYDSLIALRLRRQGSAGELLALIERGHSRAWRERLGLQSEVDLVAIQRALPEGTQLLDYWSSQFGSAVVSVSRSSARITPIRLEEENIRLLVDALPQPSGGGWKAPAERLSAQMLPPVLADTRHLVIVTDGPLAPLPFELLSQKGKLLIEGCDLTYVPTAAMLLRPAVSRPRFRPPWSMEFRGFADPVYGTASLDEKPGLRSRLAASAAEVRGIADELGGKSLLFLRENDLKKFVSEKSVAPILHIASHAFADPGAIEQSRILFSPPAESGGKGGPADYLFLKEAYELPLDGVELAVLSACDTERGRLLRGEGVQSFSRAFLASGARSTVTTLWRVPDQTTADFMRLFYHHLQRGESRAAALREAKLRFLRSGGPLSDPHYWAAFVLTGDGLHPLPTAIRWGTVLWVALAVVLLFFLMRAALWSAAARRRFGF